MATVRAQAFLSPLGAPGRRQRCSPWAAHPPHLHLLHASGPQSRNFDLLLCQTPEGASEVQGVAGW